MDPLPDSFRPGKFDVLCNKDEEASSKHSGNERYEEILEEHRYEYAKANTVAEKVAVSLCILDDIRIPSPDGGFVTYTDGKWFRFSIGKAVEKIGSDLRECLLGRRGSTAKEKAAMAHRTPQRRQPATKNSRPNVVAQTGGNKISKGYYYGPSATQKRTIEKGKKTCPKSNNKKTLTQRNGAIKPTKAMAPPFHHHHHHRVGWPAHGVSPQHPQPHPYHYSY